VGEHHVEGELRSGPPHTLATPKKRMHVAQTEESQTDSVMDPYSGDSVQYYRDELNQQR